MFNREKRQALWGLSLMLMLMFLLSACNLGAAPEEEATLTVQAITGTAGTPDVNATRTTQPQGGVTVFPTLTPFVFSTRPAVVPTTIVLVPNQPVYPTATTAPISIVIVSPLSGNVVSGTVQVVGSASHPNFLQYRLEFGPDPNPNNLWFSLTGVVQQQVLAGTLGVWPTNTGATPDGYYQLRLRVFLRDGTQQTTQVGVIRVQNNQPTPFPTNTTVPAPIAAFTQDIGTGVAPLIVRFTDRSQGQIGSYSWSFGDGGSSNNRNPTYTFRRAGTYTVTLRVTGQGGSSNVSRQIVVTSPQAPTASFRPNVTSGQAPLTVNFDNTSQGQITSYEWDFGDNTPDSNQAEPSHTFTAVGTYNVILKVTGPGGSSTMVQQITVVNPTIPPPVAGFSPNPANVETGDTVTFNNTTTGQVNSFLWDFNGDGVTDNTNISPTHTYTTAGTYTVRLIAIGPGGQNEITQQVVVTNPPNAPTAGFTASPESGIAPLTVNFTNTTTGDATSYAWDFNGDAVTDSTQQNPSFAFQDAGTYTVTLVATGAGGSTTASRVITVDSPPVPPTADFTFTPNSGEAPLLVQFTNTSTGNQLTYRWDFNGDSVTDSTEQNPSFSFTDDGSFNVTLTVTDPDNQTDSANQSITITAPVVPAPVANFSFTPTSGQAPLTINFTNESTGDISAYAWDFNGDGLADSNNEDPSFTFNTGGDYTVTLNVTGAGGSNSTTRDITVDVALQAPVANFTTNTTTVVENDTVQFTDASQGQVDSYVWDFGDGQTSTEQNPSHSFAAAGSYTVSLTVSNAAGSSAPFTTTITVADALQAPVADFTASESTPDTNEAVQFTSTSQGQVDSYVWDFGDGQTSTEQNPSHSFAAAGSYTVSLTVSNAAGSSAPFTTTITVSDALQAPVANFTASESTPDTNEAVQFTSTSQGQVDTYAWDFGDGQTSTEQNPSHSFAAAGDYTVSLTVSNAAGSSAPFTTTITVADALQAPVADFTASESTPDTNEAVQFTSTSQGQVDSYVWDFGDGQTSTEQNPSHSFAAAGSYTVSLTVSNAAGSSAPFTTTITVSDALQAPVANFTASESTPDTNEAVQFTSTSQGQVDSYVWDFGDGQTSTEQNPSHSFAAAGSYTVSLTVTNAAGSSAPFTTTITVADALQAPVADFTASESTPDTNEAVQFTSTSQGQVDSYVWDFGDGQTSTEQNPSHSFAAAGSYTVSLTVSNAAGSSAPFTTTITVADALQAPVANFTVDTSPAIEGQAVQFTSTSQGQVDSYVWDFGDGQTSTEQNPVHTFAAAGDYTVSLTVTNAAGSSAPFTTTVSVQAAQQQVNITGEFAFVRDGDIFVVNGDGSNPVNATSNGADDTDPAWSPDGTKLAFSSNSAGDYDLYVLNISDGVVSQITFDRTDDTQPRWSPDGSRIAYTRTDSGNSDIYFVNPSDNGISPWLATPANESYPTWSPDGSRIAYQSDAVGSNDEIFVADVNDTNTAVNISNNDGSANNGNSADRQPSWSSNNVIAFVSNRDGDNEIYTMNPDGTGVSQLTNNNVNDRFPNWIPNGNRIVYTSNLATDGSNTESNNNIYVMRADGSEQASFTTENTDETRGVRR